MAVAATAAVSCTIDPLESPVKSDLVEVEFVAQVENDTKASFDGQKMNWEINDEIAVWDGEEVRKFKATYVNGSFAYFSGEVSATADKFAFVFPYDACGKVTETTMSISIPSVQTVSDGKSADPSAFVSTARATDLSSAVTLVNAVSLVKFTLDADGVTSFRFGGNAGEVTCGNAEVGNDGAAAGSTDKYVTVVPAGGKFEKGTYYAAIAPSVFANGISVSYTAPAGKYAISSSSEVTFPRNGGFDLGAVTSNAKAKALPLTIANADDLMAFGSQSGMYSETDRVTLSNDIDMTGKTWTAADFAGYFDGGKHAITNLEIQTSDNCGFFGTVSGTVADLTFGKTGGTDSRFVNVAGTDTAYVAPILKLTGKGTLSNVVNNAAISADLNGYTVAGIVAVSESEGTITGCTNNADISFATGSTYGVRTSGIVGSCMAATTISGCTNNGAINYNGASTGSSVMMAGIIARSGAAVSIISCTNNGTMSLKSTVKGEGSAYLSGIAGYLAATNPKEISGCKNYGAVLCESQTFAGKSIYIGGIVSRYYQCGCEIKDSHNEGNLTNKTYCTACFIGGICGYTATVGEPNMISCTNKGNLYCSGNSSHSSKGANDNPDFALGGIVGFANATFTVSGCSNSGNIHNNSSTKTAGNIATSAGIVGGWWDGCTATISNCTNSGDVLDDSAPTTSNPTLIAGIVGRLASESTISGCTNSGKLTRGGTETKGGIYIAGICASSPTKASSIKDCKNLKGADILLSANTTSAYIGGILAGAAGGAAIDNCINEADVKQTSDCSSGSYAGGIVGNYSEKDPAGSVKNSSNSGNFLNQGAVKSYFRWGGICGNVAGTKAFEKCSNSGNIVNESATLKEIRLAGIVASGTSAASTFTECTNEGNISSTTASAETVTALDLGGIIAYNGSGTAKVTDCVTKANITSTVGGTCTKARIGGAVGYSSGLTMTGCKVKANITTTGTYTANSTAAVMGSCNADAGPTITKTGYAGNVNGLAVTAENWSNLDLICLEKKASGKIDVSGGAESIYLLTE